MKARRSHGSLFLLTRTAPKLRALGAARKLVMICCGVLKNRTPFDANGPSRIAT